MSYNSELSMYKLH